MPVLVAMHVGSSKATERATRFDTYSDFIDVNIQLHQPGKKDFIGKLPTSKTDRRAIRRRTNNQRKIWNPEVELGD
jgi:hypothetical protein